MLIYIAIWLVLSALFGYFMGKGNVRFLLFFSATILYNAVFCVGYLAIGAG
jgi:hypothetical protein